MSFKAVIGHENQVSYIKNSIMSKSLSHAFIFEGIDGIGKELIATSLVKALFCEALEVDACGSCRSCKKLSNDNHPDYMEIEPDGKSIKNAQIEDFQEFAIIKPYDSSHKIVIIKEADKMNASSQNRILKTLEEPPEHVIIIMITNNSEVLLPTVVSRCQILKFNGVSDALIKSYINSNYSTSEEEAEMIARLAVGSIGRAIEYMESDEFKVIMSSTIELLNAINSKQQSKVLELLGFFTSNKENIVKILDYMILWYRDIIRIKIINFSCFFKSNSDDSYHLYLQ
jgi:DNA polymerase-3 subunit delta'